MIQLTHLKLQQVMSHMVPDGVYLDADGLAEIDLGNGTNYNPQEALNMFFQTGSVLGRSFTADGDQNPAKVPVQQIQNAGGGNKIQSLIQTYNYYLQMIRDVTGLNEARDASVPDPKSLVGEYSIISAIRSDKHSATSAVIYNIDCSICLVAVLEFAAAIFCNPTNESGSGVPDAASLSPVTSLIICK